MYGASCVPKSLAASHAALHILLALYNPQIATTNNGQEAGSSRAQPCTAMLGAAAPEARPTATGSYGVINLHTAECHHAYVPCLSARSIL